VALRAALHERGLSFRKFVPASSRLDSAAVSAEEVDEYLRPVEEPKRSTLQKLRSTLQKLRSTLQKLRGTLQKLRGTILEIVPEAEQVISYGPSRFPRTR
jgi:hypothetical protein